MEWRDRYDRHLLVQIFCQLLDEVQEDEIIKQLWREIVLDDDEPEVFFVLTTILYLIESIAWLYEVDEIIIHRLIDEIAVLQIIQLFDEEDDDVVVEVVDELLVLKMEEYDVVVLIDNDMEVEMHLINNEVVVDEREVYDEMGQVRFMVEHDDQE